MPILEEVDGGSDDAGSAENLKAEFRRRRGRGAGGKTRKRKKRSEGSLGGGGKSLLFALFPGAILLCVGFYSLRIARDRKSNSCKMTWSKPSFVPLLVPSYLSEGHHQGNIPERTYRLLRYIDGNLPEDERAEPMEPMGMPVVFVPGHVGNFSQVRSIGLHAAKASIADPTERLDFFTLDFHGERSALHGSIVWKQADFLNHAVNAILELYRDTQASISTSRSSVAVIGHSLGGLVARAAFTLPSHRPGSISDILTLGTPHNRAAWAMDYSILSVYQCTDSLWRWHEHEPSTSVWSSCWSLKGIQPGLGATQVNGGTDAGVPEAEGMWTGGEKSLGTDQKLCAADRDGREAAEACASVSTDPEEVTGEFVDAAVQSQGLEAAKTNASVMGWGGPTGADAETLLGNTVLLSVSGGVQDLMVHPSLCVADGLGLEGQSISFTTAAMDGCGFGVDHLALVWCLQLADRLVQVLSEMAKMNAEGVDSKTRAARAATSLTYPGNSTDVDVQWGTVEAVGFIEAAREGSQGVLLARSLLTDRSSLIFPAWVLIAGLIFAATLIRGLAAKTPKHGVLPQSPVILLMPSKHLHLNLLLSLLHRCWVSVRLASVLVKTLIVAGTITVALRVGVVDVATLVPTFGPSSAGYLIPGFSAVHEAAASVLGVLDRVLSEVIRLLNPFQRAGDALRLPPVKGLLAVYFVTLAGMLIFVFVVKLLGEAGGSCRRLFKRSPVPVVGLVQAFQSRRVAIMAGGTGWLALLVMVHVEHFSFPPSFRRPTLLGELSVVFLSVSLILHALLGSLVLFPAPSARIAAHQHMLLLLYAPAPAFLLGPQLAAIRILTRNAAAENEAFVSPIALVSMSLALVPVIVSVWHARVGREFPSPPGIRGFLAFVQMQMERDLAAANGLNDESFKVNGEGCSKRASESADAELVTAALESPHGHGACGKCLHEDGGRGAVFVETDRGMIPVGGGVTLGPGFRVVACDCYRRESDSLSTWCEFCSCLCDACGGCKEAGRAFRRSRKPDAGDLRRGGSTGEMTDRLGRAGSTGLLSVFVVYLGLWYWGMKMMEAPCHCMFALSVMGGILCSMHAALAKDASYSG